MPKALRIQQVRTRYNVPIVSGCTAVSAPEYYPYVQSGQLLGLLGGLAGLVFIVGVVLPFSAAIVYKLLPDRPDDVPHRVD